MPLMKPEGADFPESVKLEARKLAAFKCCYCRDRAGDHVHHIVPKEEGGLGALDNAIFLCVQCHTDYGHRADKRVQLRQARDHWYETAAKKYGPAGLEQLARLDDMATKRDVQAVVVAMASLFEDFKAGVITGTTTGPAIMSVASTMINSIAPRSTLPGSWAKGTWAPGVWLTYCGGCKAKLPDGAAFCPQCGVKVAR